MSLDKELIEMNESEVQDKTRFKHGGPYDRGTSDSYYRRGRRPHHWPEGTRVGKKVEEPDMSPEEVAEYHKGYEDNDDYKEWE